MGRTSDARERLVDEACRLFHARSYESVGVQELCEAAAINKGSFYHFFASKDDLAAAVIDAQWQTTRDELLDPTLADDVPPLARIERFFEQMARDQRSAAASWASPPAARWPTCPARSAATSPSCAASSCACTTRMHERLDETAARRRRRRASCRAAPTWTPRRGGARRAGRRAPCCSPPSTTTPPRRSAWRSWARARAPRLRPLAHSH